MRLLREHATAVSAVLVFLAAIGVRFAFWSEIRGSALDRWHEWDQTDMATYIEQARRIAEEDWLASEPYHPYHSWQKLAPPEKWLEWYGPHSFHQAPGYSYLLALAGLLRTNPLPWNRAIEGALPWIKTFQLVLGAGTCVLTLLIARRLAGTGAGLCAGLVAAFYGPLLYLEPQVLREGAGAFGLTGIVLLLLRHISLRHAPTFTENLRTRSEFSALALGLSLGVFCIFHEMGTVLAAVVFAALTMHHVFGVRRLYSRSIDERPPYSAETASSGNTTAPSSAFPAEITSGEIAARSIRPLSYVVGPLGVAVAGFLLGFSPLLARNLAVGAPPFSISCRTLINFVEANEARALQGGATFNYPGPNVVRILDQAEGSFSKALAGVWASYDGDVGWALRNWSKRFAAIWQRPEAADNTSYYFYRNLVRTLKVLPTFSVLFPLGFAGAVLIIAGALLGRTTRVPVPRNRVALDPTTVNRSKRAADFVSQAGPSADSSRWPTTYLFEVWRRCPAGHVAMLLALSGIVASLSLVHTVARFRLYVVPFFWVYAGILVAVLVGILWSRAAAWISSSPSTDATREPAEATRPCTATMTAHNRTLAETARVSTLSDVFPLSASSDTARPSTSASTKHASKANDTTRLSTSTGTTRPGTSNDDARVNVSNDTARYRLARRLVALLSVTAACLLGWGVQALATGRETFTTPRPSDYATASEIALESGDFPLAIRVAEDAVRYYPRNPTYFAAVAWQYERQGEFDLAVEYYRRAIALSPGNGYLQEAFKRAMSRSVRR